METQMGFNSPVFQKRKHFLGFLCSFSYCYIVGPVLQSINVKFGFYFVYSPVLLETLAFLCSQALFYASTSNPNLSLSLCEN